MKKHVFFHEVKTFNHNNGRLHKVQARESEAQLLMIGGITICVIIIVASAATISLSSINIPVDETSSIKSEFDNIREKFGLALQDRLHGKLDNISLVLLYFNDTRNLFTFAEARHDNYFDAVFVGITSTTDEPDGIVAFIVLGDNHDCISERVEYYIG